MAFTELSNDAAILNFIFAKGSISFAPPAAAPAAAAAPASPSPFAAEEAAHRAATAREVAAVAAAEGGRLDEAAALLDALCAEQPTRASAFNNRAQLRRLQGRQLDALADLDAAVALGSAWEAVQAAAVGTPRHPLAEYQRRVLLAAHTQRAAHHRGAGAADAEAADLAAAARLGSPLALLVTTQVRHPGRWVWVDGARRGVPSEREVRENAGRHACTRRSSVCPPNPPSLPPYATARASPHRRTHMRPCATRRCRP